MDNTPSANESASSDSVVATPSSTLGVENEVATLPAVFRLRQNYPNPFNPHTTIQYDLPVAADIRIVVYDLLGREVVRLVSEHMQPGQHQLVWNGRDAKGRQLPTGLYIVRMVTPGYSKSIKMVLLK